MTPRNRSTDRPIARTALWLGSGAVLTAAGAALVLAGGVPTVAGAARLGHDDPVARRVEQQAFELINRASRRVMALRGSCRPSFPRGGAAIVDGGPGPQVSSLLGVFRRAPTAADQAANAALAARPPQNPFFAEVPRDAARVVTTADGTRVTLVAATKLRVVGPAPAARERCQAATRSELVRISLRAKTVVRRTALREFDALGRRERAATPSSATEGLEVRLGGGGGGGPFDPEQFLDQPVRVGTGRADRAHVILVVPDGVVRVMMTLPRYSSRGRYRAPLDRGRAVRRSARVVDNVASIRVTGRGAEDTFGASVVEYGSDGAIVRIARPPG